MQRLTGSYAEYSYEDLGVSLIRPEQAAQNNDRRPENRVVILPDWQGGHTPYANRMAAMFGHALKAETVIFNPYPNDVRPDVYLNGADGLISRMLANLDQFRWKLRSFLARARPLWSAPDTPLILMGFCFGGTAAFEAARVDDSISLAFSVHGRRVIDPARMRRPGPGPAMHYIGGGADGLVPKWTVSAFREEIAQRDVEGSLNLLPGQGHSFTKKEIGFVGPLSRYSAPALFRTLELTTQIVADWSNPTDLTHQEPHHANITNCPNK
jgi:dienelactone hydrolase